MLFCECHGIFAMTDFIGVLNAILAARLERCSARVVLLVGIGLITIHGIIKCEQTLLMT